MKFGSRAWSRWLQWSLLAACLAPCRLLACAACFGRSDDAQAKGMNMGILTLLLFVLFVLSGVAAFGIYLVRRSAQFAALQQAGGPVDQPNSGLNSPPERSGTDPDFGTALSEPTN